jgi:hypothetical protein
MHRSMAKRLADLEQLERERAQPPERVLCVFLQIRPDDYAVLRGDNDAAAMRVFAAYGLGEIGAGERVNVWGGTWPYPMVPTELTVYHDQDAEGYGIRIDAWPMYADAPAPASWRWCVARCEPRPVVAAE